MHEHQHLMVRHTGWKYGHNTYNRVPLRHVAPRQHINLADSTSTECCSAEALGGHRRPYRNSRAVNMVYSGGRQHLAYTHVACVEKCAMNETSARTRFPKA